MEQQGGGDKKYLLWQMVTNNFLCKIKRQERNVQNGNYWNILITITCRKIKCIVF